MKKFFNLTSLLVLVCMLTSVFAFAQVVMEPVVQKSALSTDIVTIFLPALLASVVALFSDASKYFNSPEWSWKIFMSTKVQTFGIIAAIALVVVVIKSLLPIEYSSMLLNLFGGSTEIAVISSATLFGFATALYDNFSKKK